VIADSLQIQMALAMLAALDNRPDALARGDAAAKALVDANLWSVVDHATYLARAPEERLAFWAKGGPLQDAVYQPSLLAMVKAAYDSYYGGFLPLGPAYKAYAGLVAAGEVAAAGAAAAASAAAAGLTWIFKGVLVVGFGLGAIYIIANRSSA